MADTSYQSWLTGDGTDGTNRAITLADEKWKKYANPRTGKIGYVSSAGNVYHNPAESAHVGDPTLGNTISPLAKADNGGAVQMSSDIASDEESDNTGSVMAMDDRQYLASRYVTSLRSKPEPSQEDLHVLHLLLSQLTPEQCSNVMRECDAGE